MRLALLSDIHGNLHALREVLEDVGSQGVDQIVNLGDSLSGPLLPRETAELLMAQPWIQLAGNHERQLLRFDAATGGESDRYALSRLTPPILDWLASLKPNADLPGGIHLCHGTPRSDHQYFLESVDPAGIRPATAQEVEDRMAGVSARLIACGHTHVPRVIRSRNGTLIVNPGSVGLPAYDDDQPYPHVVETGTTDARYAVVEERDGALHVALRSVPYEHRAAADLARRNGRGDWERALSSGYLS